MVLSSIFFRSGESGLSRFFALIALLICYPPALVYRYSIKSAFLLYLPIVYISEVPSRLSDAETRDRWVMAFGEKAWERIRFVMTLLTLLVAFFAIYDPMALASLLGQNVPLGAFSIWFVVDFSNIQPWQLFTLPNAVLTLFLFFWADFIGKEIKCGIGYSAAKWKIDSILFLGRVRAVLVFIWLSIAAVYAAYYLRECRALSAWILPILDLTFSLMPWLGEQDCVPKPILLSEFPLSHK